MDGIIVTVLWVSILMWVVYRMLVLRTLCMFGQHDWHIVCRRAGELTIVEGCERCHVTKSTTFSEDEMREYTERHNVRWREVTEEELWRAKTVYGVDLNR
jgi:hypothetical protein